MRYASAQRADLCSGPDFPSVSKCTRFEGAAKDLLVRFDGRLRNALMVAKTEALQLGSSKQRREIECALVTVLMSVVTDAGFSTLDREDEVELLQDDLRTVMAECFEFSNRKYGVISMLESES